MTMVFGESAANMQPTYAAMAACSAVLKQIKHEESERQEIEMMQRIFECDVALGNLIDSYRQEPDASTKQGADSLKMQVMQVNVLCNMLCFMIQKTREILDKFVCANVKSAMPAMLDSLEHKTMQVHEIAEYLGLAIDDDFNADMKKTLGELKLDSQSSADWKTVLESV